MFPRNVFKQKKCMKFGECQNICEFEDDANAPKLNYARLFKQCRKRCFSAVYLNADGTNESKIEALNNVKATDEKTDQKLEKFTNKQEKQQKKSDKKEHRQERKELRSERKITLQEMKERRQLFKADRVEAKQCIEDECVKFLSYVAVSEECKSCRSEAALNSPELKSKFRKINKICKKVCFPNESLDESYANKYKFHQGKANCFEKDFNKVNKSTKKSCIKDTCWPKLSEECQTCKKS
jgi:hypothetical protein